MVFYVIDCLGGMDHGNDDDTEDLAAHAGLDCVEARTAHRS